MQRRVQVLHFVFLVALAVVLAACPAPAAPQAPVVQTVVVTAKETVVSEVTQVVETLKEVEVAASPTPWQVAEAPAPAAPFVGEAIRLGVQLPLSGSYATEGLAIKQAVEVMVEQANSRGRIDGREVILLVEDDRGDPAMATQAAERLVDQGVTAVIGSYNAVTTDPASYVYWC